MTLPYQNSGTSKCTQSWERDHNPHADIRMDWVISKGIEQMVKADSLTAASCEGWLRNQVRAAGSEMINCRKRDLESLQDSINVAKAIIQNIRDLNLRFTDRLFESLVKIQTTLKNSF